MKIKKNDTIKVLAGKDRGKTGKVLRAYPAEERVVVEGVNLMVKHIRARKSGERGQRMYLPGRIATSKIQLVCPQCGAPTRVGIRRNETARASRERFCKKCKTAL
ncbi:MAG: 50S ribosomal protein L24 [Patescibacteria group bacterium]